MSRMEDLRFPEEPDQSLIFHKRKRWACWVYRAVLTLLAASSLGMSIYAVYQVPMKENGATGGTPWKAHEVTQNTSYRMWNPVSMSNDGLLLLNPSNGNVHCNGSFSGGGSGLRGLSTAITSEFTVDTMVSLLFNHRGKLYVLTADTKQNSITALEYISGSFSDNSRFTFDYYWSYTFFQVQDVQNKLNKKKFLGCDSTGKATLVDGMQSSDYPNPQALFILNKV